MQTHYKAACLLTCIDAKLLQLVNGLEVFDLFSFRVLLFPIQCRCHFSHAIAVEVQHTFIFDARERTLWGSTFSILTVFKTLKLKVATRLLDGLLSFLCHICGWR